MPNYKVFQDTPESMRIKIYGTDSAGDNQAILTNTSGTMSMSGIVGVSGNVGVSGSVTAGISGSVAVSGPIEITSSGTLAISGSVTAGISGSVAVSGPIEITSSGTLAISGSVTAGISGSVAVSGPIEITSSGTLAISGAVTAGISGAVAISGSVAVSGPLQISGTVALSGHSIVDSGPLTADVTPTSSGEVSGAFDVLSYSSWTLAVEYSGSSGAGVSVVLQKSAVSGAVASGGDWIFDSSGTFTSDNWLFFTAGITPRYMRLYYVNTGTGSGTLYQTFQAQN